MIIVCDTNVLISAFLFPGGNPDKIVKAILSGRFMHGTSPDLLEETRMVFETKFKLDREKVRELIELIASNSKLVYSTRRLSIVSNDDADNRVLEAAITAKAHYIVTGDKRHLIPLKRVHGMHIVTPAEFVKKFGIV